MVREDIVLFESYFLHQKTFGELTLGLARAQLQTIIDPEWAARSNSFGESIDAASEASIDHRRRAALLLLRALGVDGLICAHDPQAQLERRIVALVTKAVPDICKFYSIDEKKQNFEKFAALETVYGDLESRLDVMRHIDSQPASFAAARQGIQKALNHSMVKSYLQHYDVIRITQTVQTLFAKFEESQETQNHEFPVLLSRIQSNIAAEFGLL